MAYPYQLYTPYQYYGQVQQQATHIQNGGFVLVKSIEEARNYPVAPGNSVTFKNENAPYVYTKTLGFSQLDEPIFEIFKLIKEEDSIIELNNPTPSVMPEYLTIDDANAMRAEISTLKDELNFLREYIEDDRKGEKVNE